MQPRSNAEILGGETTGAPRAVKWDVEPFHWADDPDSSIARYEGSAKAGEKEGEWFGGKLTAKTAFTAGGSAAAGVNHGFYAKPLGQDIRQNENGWGAEANATGGIGQKGSVEFDSGDKKPFRVRIKGDGSLGVEAKATARSNKNMLMALGELFAGGKLGARGGVSIGGLGISGNVEGLVGLGLMGKLGLEKGPDGQMHFVAYAGGSLGVGGGAGVDLTLNRGKAELTAQQAAEALNRAGGPAALANAVERADANNKATTKKKSVPVKKPNKGKHHAKGKKSTGKG